MDTLYDLLGALPQDDAESLRTAFRRAVKGAHPDLRPGDPDAAVRFRQIVRANEILCDRDQRAAYDHLLALAQLEKDPASAHPIAAKVRRILRIDILPQAVEKAIFIANDCISCPEVRW